MQRKFTMQLNAFLAGRCQPTEESHKASEPPRHLEWWGKYYTIIRTQPQLSAIELSLGMDLSVKTLHLEER